MNKQRPSWRHHYLPQCYLKGFTNEDGNIFVYDKNKDLIYKSWPKDVFFEKDRNAIFSPKNGEKIDILEPLYAHIDGIFADVLRKVIESNPSVPALSHFDKLQFSLCLSVLFCRIPTTDDEFEKIIDEKGFEGAPFHLIDPVTGEPARKDIQEMLLAHPGMRKSYRLMYAFAPFYKKKNLQRAHEWKFYYQDPGFHISGDNPFIHPTKVPVEEVLQEFIFPVAQNRLIINSDRFPAENFSREFALHFATAIVHNSERFLCCHREDWLRSVVEYYKFHQRYGKEDTIIPDLFNNNYCTI